MSHSLSLCFRFVSFKKLSSRYECYSKILPLHSTFGYEYNLNFVLLQNFVLRMCCSMARVKSMTFCQNQRRKRIHRINCSMSRTINSSNVELECKKPIQALDKKYSLTPSQKMSHSKRSNSTDRTTFSSFSTKHLSRKGKRFGRLKRFPPEYISEL